MLSMLAQWSVTSSNMSYFRMKDRNSNLQHPGSREKFDAIAEELQPPSGMFSSRETRRNRQTASHEACLHPTLFVTEQGGLSSRSGIDRLCILVLQQQLVLLEQLFRTTEFNVKRDVQ